MYIMEINNSLYFLFLGKQVQIFCSLNCQNQRKGLISKYSGKQITFYFAWDLGQQKI